MKTKRTFQLAGVIVVLFAVFAILTGKPDIPDLFDTGPGVVLDSAERDKLVNSLLYRLEERLADQSRRRDVEAGVDRVIDLARKGDREALAAIEEARGSGDLTKLQEVLLAYADRFPSPSKEEESGVGAPAGDYTALCHEIAAISYLLGDLEETERRVNAILGSDPDDNDAVNRLGILQYTRGQLEEAEHSFYRPLDLGSTDEAVTAVAYGNLGLTHMARGDLDRAEKMHRKSLEIEEKLGRSEGMANQYGNLGVVYQARGDLERAEQMHRKALEIEEKLGRLNGMASAYGNLGVVYGRRGDLDRAEQMQRKSLEINEKLVRLKGMAGNYGNLGLIFMGRGDLDQSEKMHRKALEIEEKLGRLAGMAGQYGNLGVLYGRRGDMDRAEEMASKSMEINEKLGRFLELAKDFCNLGSVYRTRGDMAQTREHWTKARDLYKTIGMTDQAKGVQGWLDILPPDKP